VPDSHLSCNILSGTMWVRDKSRVLDNSLNWGHISPE
jgi:hypothetical protein